MRSSLARCVLLLLLLAGLLEAVLIDNTVARVDTEGNLMDCHDGNIIRVGGVFHWYGMGYQATSTCHSSYM